ncbi:MAG: phosphomannomutase/phosphoglucomutase [Syntrophobacteraceae bacterium]|nr:phosphomannomutase/phosphoglucomutase [Syntrophobacteraceae bacterium]
MHPSIFREYDIRGVVDRDITDQDVAVLGRAFGTCMVNQDKRRVVLGRDCRLSSDRFREKLAQGMIEAGLDVTDLGICPTPLLYFAIRHLESDGGIMITASHNPPEYNGFKICNGFDTIFGEEIQELRRIIEAGNFVSGAGRLRHYDIQSPYIEHVVGNIDLKRRLKVGVDAGNATGGPVALPILEKLGCEVYPIYCEMNGTFPNHEPDPTVLENLRDLIDLVRKEKLDVGLAYDGDCDRLGVVDHRGEVIFGDRLMIVFAREILSRRPGTTFISEVKCSKTLYDDIERNGGRAIMWKAGHSLIKRKMREVDAVLGGEMSGHIFFKDRYFGFDDGIYASCRLLEIISNSGKTMPELLEGIPTTFTTPEIRVDCPDEVKFGVVEEARKIFRENGYRMVDVDGVRLIFPHGWGLVRASNTQPALVLRYEADSPEQMGDIRRLIEGTLEGILRRT